MIKFYSVERVLNIIYIYIYNAENETVIFNLEKCKTIYSCCVVTFMVMFILSLLQWLL
jgi:hypothetical protein